MSTGEPMIAPGYVRTMAAYNAEMNRRVFAAAERLDDGARRADRGAFWSSIHGTLAHLLWADHVWMQRFGVGEGAAVPLRKSARFVDDFAELTRRRTAKDAELLDWAAEVTPADLEGEVRWWSGAVQRDMVKPKALCVVQLFNHQTHHRGQVHAMLTAAGAATGDTDLPFVLPDRSIG
jgi:uncharacterized damage-inducible protein DinB